MVLSAAHRKAVGYEWVGSVGKDHYRLGTYHTRIICAKAEKGLASLCPKFFIGAPPILFCFQVPRPCLSISQPHTTAITYPSLGQSLQSPVLTPDLDSRHCLSHSSYTRVPSDALFQALTSYFYFRVMSLPTTTAMFSHCFRWYHQLRNWSKVT